MARSSRRNDACIRSARRRSSDGAPHASGLAVRDPSRFRALDVARRAVVSTQVRRAIVTIVLALFAGFGGVWLGKITFDHSDRRSDLHDVIHHELQLTADQRQRISTLEHDFAAKRAASEAEMRAANTELAAAIRDEHGYGPRVTAAVGRFHEAMGQLQTDMIKHVFAMREVLTVKQRETFDNSVVLALTADNQ